MRLFSCGKICIKMAEESTACTPITIYRDAFIAFSMFENRVILWSMCTTYKLSIDLWDRSFQLLLTDESSGESQLVCDLRNSFANLYRVLSQRIFYKSRFGCNQLARCNWGIDIAMWWSWEIGGSWTALPWVTHGLSLLSFLTKRRARQRCSLNRGWLRGVYFTPQEVDMPPE